MSDVIILNAASKTVYLGANDLSIPKIPAVPIPNSLFVPLIFGFTAGGPEEKTYVDGARFKGLYGTDTLDANKPFRDIGIKLAERVFKVGAPVMFKRIIPSDNDTISNVTIYLDVLKDDVDVYKRHIDGSIAYDNDGKPKIETTVKGYRIKVIAEYNEDDILTPYGTKGTKEGYMTDADGNKSTMYPIFEWRGKYKGAMYNNVGFTISVPEASKVNEGVKEANLAMPYDLQIVKRVDENSSGVPLANVEGLYTKQFVFKSTAKDPLTNLNVDFKSVYKTWYDLEGSSGYIVYPLLDDPYLYENNLNYILKAIMDVEKDYVNADVETDEGIIVNTSEWLDYVLDVDPLLQYGIVNPFTATSSKGVPAFTYYIDTTDVTLADNHDEVTFSKSTPIYLGKGKDGTLSRKELYNGIKAYMEKYLDENSDVMDQAINIENVVIDPGYPVDVTEALSNAIAYRHDMVFIGSTFSEDLDPSVITVVDEWAIATNLANKVSLFKDSEVYGTPVIRAGLAVGSGIDKKDPSGERVSITHELTELLGRFMSGQKWKSNLKPKKGDETIFKTLTNILPKTINNAMKNKLWEAGAIYPEPYTVTNNLKLYYLPALQTVYPTDESIFNNLYVAFAIAIIARFHDITRRKFSGWDGSTTDLISEVESFLNRKINEALDNVYPTLTKVIITDADAVRGYSYSVRTEIRAGVMKTVLVSEIDGKRLEE